MSAPVGPGAVLAGKYRVERVLGEGGMGVVVAARHLQLDQIVALKFLLPEAVANAEALGRFVREARNAVRLKSEHVARIIDVGTLDTGAPYIVMEFLEGSDLAGVLAQQRALAIPVAVDFILQACDAIAEAHALGIIHRDLKPQNLFVTRRHDNTSLVKVLDFGISKSLAGGGDFAATRTQAVMGSPAYMSPEQMRSAKLVDPRTDVWALGIILYQLVTGQVPWEAETFTELCFKVAMDPLPPLPSAGLPPGFENVVRRCLEKDPDRRFSDVYALAVALLPFAPPHAQPLVDQIGRVLRGQAGERAAMPTIVAPGPGTLPEAAGQRVAPTASGSRKRGITGLVAAIGVLIGIIVTALALGRGGSADKPASSPGPERAAASPAPPAPPPATPPAVAQPASAPPAAAQPPPSVPAPAATAPEPPAPAATAPEPPAPAPATPAAAPASGEAAAPGRAPAPAAAQTAPTASAPAAPANAEPAAATARDKKHRRPAAATPGKAPARTAAPQDPAKPPAAPDPLSSPD